jgi:hypothetical protein
MVPILPPPIAPRVSYVECRPTVIRHDQAMTVPYPFTCPVRGVSQYPAAVAQTRTGDLAVVRHDPANPYDVNACEVLVRDELVGYLPATLAARLVRVARQWEAQISEKLDGAYPGLRLTVRGPLGESDQTRALVNSETGPADTTLPEPRTATRMVTARSGRILGSFIEEQPGVVVVATPNGRVPYPTDLVVVSD